MKVRRRGLLPGELVVSLAECQLVGAFFDHVEDVRADRAGAELRAVAATPSAPAALQNAKRFRRVHCQRVERHRLSQIDVREVDRYRDAKLREDELSAESINKTLTLLACSIRLSSTS